MRITYLLNSGFLVEINESVLVFDDYRDPTGAVAKALNQAREAYFFASHSHFDHFSPQIADFAGHVTRYFLSDDIRPMAETRKFPAEKTSFLKEYSGYEDRKIKVTSFSSTDAGTSFLVEKDGKRIFHAGDFNWWYWKGDSQEDNRLATDGFREQMKHLEGLQADVAFFPVDGRLEEYMDIGAKEFCTRTEVKALVAMHSVGYPKWEPARDFFAAGREIPCWVPVEPGEAWEI